MTNRQKLSEAQRSLTFRIEQGSSGRFFVRCDEDKGFLATGLTVASALFDAARAYQDLQSGRARLSEGE